MHPPVCTCLQAHAESSSSARANQRHVHRTSHSPIRKSQFDGKHKAQRAPWNHNGVVHKRGCAAPVCTCCAWRRIHAQCAHMIHICCRIQGRRAQPVPPRPEPSRCRSEASGTHVPRTGHARSAKPVPVLLRYRCGWTAARELPPRIRAQWTALCRRSSKLQKPASTPLGRSAPSSGGGPGCGRGSARAPSGTKLATEKPNWRPCSHRIRNFETPSTCTPGGTPTLRAPLRAPIASKWPSHPSTPNQRKRLPHRRMHARVAHIRARKIVPKVNHIALDLDYPVFYGNNCD